MRSAVPPRAIAVIPVNERTIKGKTAMNPKKTAPSNVIRLKTFEIYAEVETPGRIPGINAPFFCKLVASASGSNVTAV